MKRIKSSFVIAVTVALLLPLSSVGYCYQNDTVSVPPSTEFQLELLSPISTQTNKKGDEFSCRVISPPGYENATVSGVITKLKSSGKVKGKSEIAFAFTKITLADGRSGKFVAQIKEVYDVVDAANSGQADPEGKVKGKSLVKRNVKRAVAGAAIGALIGAALGGGQGAAIGAGIGASVGMASTLSTKGPNLEFKTGSRFTVETGSRAR